MPWKMTDEDDDYDGPWPEGDSMTTDEAREFFRFLHGEVPWNGTWFGEYAPGERGAYWWRKILNEAIAALAAPHKTDRWNIDVDDSDGSLLICKGEHDKDEKCETVRYVPASPRPDAPDLYWQLHGLSKLLEGRGRIDEGETPDAYSTILDAMALARGPAPTAPESKGVLSMDGKPAAPVQPVQAQPAIDLSRCTAVLIESGKAHPRTCEVCKLGPCRRGVAKPVQATLPDGWVPLVVTLPDSHPEEVAYGPKVMMDRLGKWLAKHFAAVQAQGEPVAWRHSDTHDLYDREEDVVLADADSYAEPLYLHPPRADVARLRAALQFMLENFEHGDLNAGEAAALDKARDALRGN